LDLLLWSISFATKTDMSNGSLSRFLGDWLLEFGTSFTLSNNCVPNQFFIRSHGVFVFSLHNAGNIKTIAPGIIETSLISTNCGSEGSVLGCPRRKYIWKKNFSANHSRRNTKLWLLGIPRGHPNLLVQLLFLPGAWRKFYISLCPLFVWVSQEFRELQCKSASFPLQWWLPADW